MRRSHQQKIYLVHGNRTAQTRCDFAGGTSQPGDRSSTTGAGIPETDAELGVGFRLSRKRLSAAREVVVDAVGSVSLLLLIACTNIVALLLAGRHSVNMRSRFVFRWGLACDDCGPTADGSILAGAHRCCAWPACCRRASKVFQSLGGDLPRVEEIRLDWRIVLYSLACSVVASCCVDWCQPFVVPAKLFPVHWQPPAAPRYQDAIPAMATGWAASCSRRSAAGRCRLLLRSFQALGRVSPGLM